MVFGAGAVFLVLAALYESTSIPLAVMLVVPLGILGALLGVTLRSMPNDVYFKVGMIAVVGLSAKNAILIVEFGKHLQAQGMGLIEATLEAVHLRFRPIIMTSLAFILGVLPLAIASGAGSASQRAIGTGVMAGMITATVLAVFLAVNVNTDWMLPITKSMWRIQMFKLSTLRLHHMSAALLVAGLLSACTMAPTYERPQ
eukprot:gene40952-50407_t